METKNKCPIHGTPIFKLSYTRINLEVKKKSGRRIGSHFRTEWYFCSEGKGHCVKLHKNEIMRISDLTENQLVNALLYHYLIGMLDGIPENYASSRLEQSKLRGKLKKDFCKLLIKELNEAQMEFIKTGLENLLKHEPIDNELKKIAEALGLGRIEVKTTVPRKS